MTHEISSAMSACIDNCTDCHRACLETIRHCLEKGGTHADPDHVSLLLLCAEICQTSANAMVLGVHQHGHTCRACAEICRACGEACDSMSDDPALKVCADACARCADSCGRMAA
jgi:hypothetical protein